MRKPLPACCVLRCATAADLIRFVEAHMDGRGQDDPLQRAVAATRTGYYQVGGMTQGLGWEMYAYPTDWGQLLGGNSAQVIFKANPVTTITRARCLPASGTRAAFLSPAWAA